MKVTLNDETWTVDAESALSQVLESCGYGQIKGLAAAVNEVVIPRNEWSLTKLNEGDRILVIQATQGG